METQANNAVANILSINHEDITFELLKKMQTVEKFIKSDAKMYRTTLLGWQAINPSTLVYTNGHFLIDLNVRHGLPIKSLLRVTKIIGKFETASIPLPSVDGKLAPNGFIEGEIVYNNNYPDTKGLYDDKRTAINQIFFNAEYLGFISEFLGGTLAMNFHGGRGACLIEAENKSYSAVLMPCRPND